MVLINNIKNKVIDYIPDKKCPVCQKKLNKLLNNVYCSLICFFKFQVGIVDFVFSSIFMLLLGLTIKPIINHIIILLLLFVIILILVDIFN